ncbi:MAG: sugar phosphate isomerase/epimerase [Actinobacteria bacterium]|nr:sugar phosphate isomerase/epimerase [Actinomycetota bacterium]
MELKVDAHLWCLGSYAERYVPGGYFDDMAVEEKLEIFKKIKGLTGIVVFIPTHPLPSQPDKLIKLLNDYNLKVSSIEPENWSDRKWKNGAFSTNEAKIRKEAIKTMKEGIDLCREVKADSVLLWPAHDGLDYPFQSNYRDGWKYLIETIREIGEYDPDTKIAIEAKSKDPRQKQYISDTGKALALISEVGLKNVGCALDVGHAIMANENLAESVALIDRWNRLFQIHINENYKDSDPDMVFGTINFWELLEFFYYLNQTKYNSWCTIDIISSRDDRAKTLELAVSNTWKIKELADKLLEHKNEIEEHMKGYRFADNFNMIKKLVLK